MSSFPIRIRILLLFAIVLTIPITSIQAKESIDIMLGSQALKEPLMDVVLPPRTSQDSMQFLQNGISIRQQSDAEGKKTGVAGIKVHTNSSGDFTFSLDFECKRLEKPKSGWGQGLMIRVMTDDPKTPIIAFGLVANDKFQRGYLIQINHAEGVEQERFSEPLDFSKGTWTIQRVGSEFTLSVSQDTEAPVTLKTIKGTDASLSGIQVWCTRQASGNSPAEYLLKRVRFESDAMFTYQEAPTSFWNWRVLLATFIGCNVIFLAIYFVNRLRSKK